MVRKKFSQKVNHPGDKTSLCNLYLFAHTLVATCWRTMFILERDLQPAVYTCARTHEWSRPRERPRAAELCEGKSNQASGIGSTKKNGRIWNFPRKRPPFVDADRAKNRRPQCTSIFIRPPFPPFSSVSLSISFSHDVKSFSSWFFWRHRYLRLRSFLLETRGPRILRGMNESGLGHH